MIKNEIEDKEKKGKRLVRSFSFNNDDLATLDRKSLIKAARDAVPLKNITKKLDLTINDSFITLKETFKVNQITTL